MRPMQDNMLQILQERGALLRGHFLLTSGLHSDLYIEKFRILEDPELTFRLIRTRLDDLRKLSPTVVVGPTTGGILVAFATAALLGIRSFYAERNPEGPGRVLRRGFTFRSGDRVLVADDVLTTGGSVEETRKAVEEKGGQVVGIFVLIRRGAYTGDLPLISCLNISAQAFPPARCPLCQQGVPLQMPGKGVG